MSKIAALLLSRINAPESVINDVAREIIEMKSPWREPKLSKDVWDVLDWVETWISNQASSYSVAALDGLFGMTRDKIAALRKSETP